MRLISFVLATGDFATVVGSNGAGKSTLLNAVAGVWPCDSGRIILNDQDLTDCPEHKRAQYVARVFQNPLHGLVPPMSIEEHLSIAVAGRQAFSFRRGVTALGRQKFRAALQALGLGLENDLKAPVGILSGGQQQALALLMATIRQPALLLLDECAAGLDPQAATRILDLTAQAIREQKLTALMVTHNIEHALRYGNRLLLLHHGRMVLDIGADEKKTLTVAGLISRFEHQTQADLGNHRGLPEL